MALFRKKAKQEEPMDLESVMKKFDQESNVRVWEGKPRIAVNCVLAAFSLFCLYVTLFASWLEELRTLAAHEKVKAIGEIGLDYYWKENPPKDFQKMVFHAQMELAEELGLPVIIHDREAHQDCLEVVKAHPNVKGVYHCYSGSLEDAKVLTKLGWMLSFTGVVTYKNARKSLEVIDWLPLDRMMIETDAPYLTPDPWRGKRNDSAKVYRVAETIAAVKGIDPEETARITLENGKRFFGID